MYPRSVRSLQADALFASVLQRSDELNATQVWRAVAVALTAYGGAGCAERVAQEFGDHPEAAAARMRWARATVAILEGQPVPRTRRIVADDSFALGRNPATGLSAIRSA
jgi:hypothetical protein